VEQNQKLFLVIKVNQLMYLEAKFSTKKKKIEEIKFLEIQINTNRFSKKDNTIKNFTN